MSKLVKYIIGFAVTAIVLFLIWYFSDIVAYILISAVLAIIGKPLVDALVKIKIGKKNCPRWLAALVALLCIWGVAVVFLYLFIPLVFGKISQLSNMDIGFVVNALQEPLQQMQEFIVRFFAIENDSFSIVNEITSHLAPLLNLDVINNALGSVVTVIGNMVIALFSITFITYFFLKQDKLFRNMLVAVFPNKYEQNIIHALDSVTNLLIRYFTGILLESTIIMLLLAGTLMLWGLGAETAFFMGLVMGVLNVIPYIGPLIGASICITVGIITPVYGASMTSMILIIGGSILAVKMLDDFVLQPVLYSNRVKAHPLEIFLVILIAGSVAGILGMLLAIPSYTVLRVFAKEFFNHFPLVQKLTENI